MIRINYLSYLIGGLFAFTGLDPAYAQTAPENFACLNETLSACKAVFQKQFKIVETDIDKVSASWGQTDVSGNYIRGQDRASVTIELPSTKSGSLGTWITFRLNLSVTGRVWNIDVSMKGDPANASTEQEYDRTNLYYLFGPFMPKQSCPFSDRASFYRFFNDFIKPNIDLPKRDIDVQPTYANDEYEYRSKRMPICGAYLDYQKDTGISSIYMDRENPSGRFTTVDVTLWSEPDPVP